MVAKKRAHKTQVLILQTYQGSELGSLRYDSGMIRSWFGVWFGDPFFLNSGSFVAWVSFSHRQPTTIAIYLMAAMARPARRPWTGPEYEECEDLNAHLWFISAGLRRLFWMFFSCTFSSATIRLMFLFDGFLVWLPASQPATAASATQQAASHAASQPQLASPIASHPTSISNWASHLASQPATHPEPASLGIMMRLTPWRYVKVARDHRVWPTLVN